MTFQSPPFVISVPVILLCLYRLVIYPFFLHPLRHIPSAHWSIPIFGDLWITYQRYLERNNAITYAAHQAKGEVVRLGSNELSVNCVEDGIKTIYGAGWEKHVWYPQLFGMYGVMNMFATVHHKPHSQKKRIMSNVYSKSYIASSPSVHANSRALFGTRILPTLQKFSETGETVEVHGLNNAMTMDFMSAFQFGLKAGTNFTQDIAARQHFLHRFHCRRDYDFFHAELPWLVQLSETFKLSVVPKFVDDANVFLGDFVARMCRAADEYLANSQHAGPRFIGDEPIVYNQFKNAMATLRAKDSSAGKAFSGVTLPTSLRNDLEQDETSLEVYAEMLGQLGAGHETSAIALTYLYWEMSKNPVLQKELHLELKTLSTPITWPVPKDSDHKDFELPDPKEIDALPLLNAITMETLRLHSPIPGFQPRISPNTPGGSKLGKYSGIPGNVRVSSMPYTLHRNGDVFTNPETYDPKRWLPSHTSGEQLKEMNRWFWAFGSGGRMCIGSNLATQEIKLTTAAIYSNWKTTIVDDAGIEPVDAYTTRPTSNKLNLRFTHV